MKKFFTLGMVLFWASQIGNAQNFIEVAAANGINSTCGLCSLGSGVSFVDFNGDGLDDLTFATQQGSNVLFYQNTGSGFIQITAPITNTGLNEQIIWVDFDNDGDRDLLVTSFESPTRLYENIGNFNFADITANAGLPINNAPTYGAVFGDYNNDGLLDLYIDNWSYQGIYSNRLYKNNGDRTFTDVTDVAGVADGYKLTFCSAFLDINNNGLQDLYNSQDRPWSINSMFKNNGDGTFQDISSSSNTDIGIDAMNVGVGDYDNDGDLDIYVTNNAYAGGNQLLRNNGNETFTDVAPGVGVTVDRENWGGNFFDADNDLDLDLYVSTQHMGIDHASELFLNNNNGASFTEANLPGMVGDTMNSFSNAIGDFNNDGWPDIVVNNATPLGAPQNNFHLWQNTTNNSNHWLKVNLIGTESNREGIGSWIEIYINGNKYVRYKHCGIAYLAQNSTIEHFGLGPNTMVDSLIVRWLSGNEDILYDVSANDILTIVEGSSPLINCDNVNILPPVSSNAEICEAEPFPILTATAEPGYEVSWYGNPTGGPLLAQSSTTYTPTGAGTFYAETQDPSTGCKSATRTAVTLIIHENPTVNGGLNEFACQGTPVTFTAVAAGGDGNYSFAWPNGLSNTAQLTVAPPTHTSYTVTVTDGNGCTGTDVVTAVVYELPTVMASADGTICSGVCTTLGASASGGTSPYSYSWSGGSAQVCPTTTTVYTVTVTDNHGCEDTDEQMINVLPTPVANAGMDGNVCAGDCYTFAPSASGGEMPYTFQWSGVQQTEVCPAETTTYTLTVTGNNGCSATDDLTLTVVDLPQVEAGTDENLCQGACYTFAPTASGGTGSYGYAWSSGTTEVCPTQTTPYTVTVTDGNGCSSTDQITLNVFDLPTVNAGDDVSLCLGACYTFTPSGSGGSGTYSYAWSGGQTTVCPESTMSYTVTITDGNGCTSTDEITIEVLSLPQASAGSDQSFCEGGCYTFFPTATGGSGGYSYAWSSGTTEVCPTQTTNYTLTVTDSNGCAATDELMITVWEVPTVDAGADINLCQGACYTFAPTTSGGTGSYSYAWSSGTTEVCPTQTTSYTVTVTDGNGCSSTDQITVNVFDLPTVNAGDDASICAGDCYTFSPSAFGGSGNYSYAWSSGQATVCPAGTTTYTVTVTDANGCTATDEIMISVTMPPSANAGNDVALCVGDCYTFEPVAGGGSPPYNFSWSGDGSTTVCPSQTTTYILTVTDTNGCSAQDNIQVTVHSLPSLDAGSDVVICEGSCYTFAPTASGGSGSYSYSWSSVTTEVCPIQTTTYTVTVTDGNGCSVMDGLTVFVSPLPEAFAGADVTLCPGDCYTFNPTGSEGAEPYTYAWSGNESTVCPSQTSTYTVTLTDANGCTATDDLTLSVLPPLATVAASDASLCPGDCYTLSASATGGSGSYTYAWNGNETTVCPNQTTTYTVTATDENGCTALDELTLTVYDPTSPLAVSHELCEGDCVDYAASTFELMAFVIEEETTSGLTFCEAGTYTIEALDGNGCTTSVTFTIEVTAPPTANAGADQTLTCSVTEVTIGQNLPEDGIAYSWSNDINTPQQTINEAGTYVLTATNTALGCSTSDEVEININTAVPTADAGTDLELTCAQSTALANGTASSQGTGYSYQWTTTGGTILNGGMTLIPELSAPGTYLLTVLNSENGCVSQDELTVTEAELPELALQNLTHVECPDGATGSITVEGTGGADTYSYAWSNGATGATIGDLSAGMYTVTLTDGNSCEVSLSIQVTDPPAIVLVLSATAETGSSANDGSITATVSGGTPGYEYLWSTGGTGSTIENLSPALYHLSVTDSNGCMKIDSARVNSFDCQSITTQTTANNYICPGSSSGSLSIDEITGGTAPYNILWSTGSSAISIGSLAGGHYSTTITDANNCEVILPFDVTEEDTIAPTLITQDITVYLDENGTAELTAAMIDGGSSDNCSAVSFELNNTALNCTNTGSQEYAVKLWDENGNSDSTTVMITVLDTIAPVFIFCPENVVSMNCLAVEYELPEAEDNCGIETMTQTEGLSTGSTFVEGVTPIVYQVSDASGNTATCSFTVTVENTLEVESTFSAYSCDPVYPFTATLTATGGTAEYSYLWNDSSTSQETILAAPGPWSWTVTDSQGCEQSGEITATIPDTISITLIATASTDMEWNGAIDATVTGGSGTYGFEWRDEMGNLFATGEDLDGIPAGNYCLWVFDEDGCIAGECVEVENITGTGNIALDQSIVLSPNPTSNILRVQFDLPKKEKATLNLLDINGHQLWQTEKRAEVDEVEVDMRVFSEGVYLLKIVTGDRMTVKRVVVNR